MRGDLKRSEYPEFCKDWCEFADLIQDVEDGIREFDDMARAGLRLFAEVVKRGRPTKHEHATVNGWIKRLNNHLDTVGGDT